MADLKEIVEGYDQSTGLIEVTESKCTIMAGWDHVPHLSPQAKKELYLSTPPYLREARSKGIPSLGAGAIYPIAEADIIVDDFPIPVHWPQWFGEDVGWNNTAVAWFAEDREGDTLYIHSVYKRGRAEPAVHASAIKSRGDWIPGVIDPAAGAANQKDGEKLLELYEAEGLELYKADNSVESGIYAVYQRLTTGRLKIFRSCAPWFAEYRLYRRDDKGRVVKEFDHLMDATRYGVQSGPQIGKANLRTPSWRDKLKTTRPRGAMSG